MEPTTNFYVVQGAMERCLAVIAAGLNTPPGWNDIASVVNW